MSVFCRILHSSTLATRLSRFGFSTFPALYTLLSSCPPSLIIDIAYYSCYYLIYLFISSLFIKRRCLVSWVSLYHITTLQAGFFKFFLITCVWFHGRYYQGCLIYSATFQTSTRECSSRVCSSPIGVLCLWSKQCKGHRYGVRNFALTVIYW